MNSSIDEELKKIQEIASNPNNSVWVSASAGTGKTTLLTKRILRLLLNDTPPESILCITYTKSGASEILERINEKLANWSLLDEEELIKEIESLQNKKPRPKELTIAKGLFNKINTSYKGLNIQTIHSFCQSLLNTFPIEAGVPLKFNIESNTKELVSEAIVKTLNNSKLDKDLENNIAILNQKYAPKTIEGILETIMNNQSFLLQMSINPNLAIKNYQNRIKEVLEVNDTENKDIKSKHAKMSINALAMAKKVFQVYSSLKTYKNILTFDDILNKTLLLLQREDILPWVMYKINSQINHILVDESQDTTEIQWQIIKEISNHFFVGESGNETNKSIFIVGDIKQSILSFQGSKINTMLKMKDFFSKKFQTIGKKLIILNLKVSFRSSPDVTNIVTKLANHLFAQDTIYVNEDLQHTAYHNFEGYIEFYEMEDKKGEIFATHIMKQIDKILQNKDNKPSDIMILSRTKNSKITPILKEILSSQAIPFISANYKDTTEHPVFKDLLMIARFLLNQNDDIALASLLRSSIFNLTEQNLYEIRIENKQETLFNNLLKNEKYKYICKILLNWINLKADHLKVSTIYQNIIFNEKNINKFIDNFAGEAEYLINIFMECVEHIAAINPFSLEELIDFIENNNENINKRKQDISTNEINAIKMMTMHSSKGLEAKFVFIIEEPQRKPNYSVIPLHDTFFINLKEEERKNYAIYEGKITNFIKNKEKEEDKRLMYVALTRARNGIYMYSRQSGKNSLPWATNLKNIGLNSKTIEIIEKNNYIQWNLEANNYQEFPHYKKSDIDLIGSTIFPSQKNEDDDFYSPLTQNKMANNLKKGQIVHHLLEVIPNIEKNRQKQYIDIYLKNNKINQENANNISTKIENIISHPDLQEIFNGNSFNEITVGEKQTINGKSHIILGRIDKIYIKEKKIIIIDYKTSQQTNNIPNYMKEQMNAYKQILSSIYNTNNIKTFILFIENIILFEV